MIRDLFGILGTKKVPLLIRRFSLCSTKKDPDLESALSRNKRWIVNSRLKNVILRCPNQVASVKFLQKKFKTLDLQGKALNWLKKYPCCFHVYLEDDEYYCRLTKPMMTLVEEEELVKDAQEPVLADRLAKLLMMSVNQRLNVVKLNEFKRSFGFPDDYVIRILPKYSDVFRIVNYSGRKSSMEIELLLWKPELAVSAVEAAANKCGSEPSFSCSLPSTWTKPWERFMEFNNSPYISPYEDHGDLVEGSKESEKRSVGLVHELLSLTLWKKLSIVKLSHFKREFGLPEKLNSMLLKHPGIFYVANKYQVHTVLLREGYNGSELIHKDPLVVVKGKFGELMQQGLYEYNHRRYLANQEKKREKGIESLKSEVRKKDRIHDEDDVNEQESHGDRPGGLFDTEERKRFYQILFSDNQ
ncbi:PREDICTED: protein ROOT PRIMORDIUM DEFECTIVE 1-like [Camelina sativa]|uniref:Protein ROOT PRIMORDIUM DEFECTIVE 1-like n=1 Tax=Camelina sativa TaxID=90675 RepID=A0ABM0SPA2_CAMSA|nr:PREDICTED: protein ROOT PRIMORDIUM DEFECTIVE 1-like [Camelina sativa]